MIMIIFTHNKNTYKTTYLELYTTRFSRLYGWLKC